MNLRKAFRPEFLNRIDEIIVFHSLEEETYRADRNADVGGTS